MGELDLDALFTFFRKNPWLAAVAVYLIASFLRAITRGVKGDAGKAKTARIPERRVTDGDLQERVRAGFEQMLRERAAGRGAAAPAPGRPAPTRPASARPAPAAAPAPVKLAPAPARTATVLVAPRSIIAVRHAGSSAAGLPASLQARAKRIRRADDEALTSRGRLLLNDRASLRGAMLASEILARPLALRESR